MLPWFAHIDSTTVLWGQMIIYTIYCLAIISVVAYIARRLTRPPGRPSRLTSRVFYAWVGFLVVIGVSLHIITYNTIPWVKDDLAGTSEVAATYSLSIGKDPANGLAPAWRFDDPSAIPLVVPCEELVRFSVTSLDNTYGFGIFRPDHTMVAQMQVVPGHANDLLWTFTANGSYTIRSTEYAGPSGYRIIVPGAISVTDCR